MSYVVSAIAEAASLVMAEPIVYRGPSRAPDRAKSSFKQNQRKQRKQRAASAKRKRR